MKNIYHLIVAWLFQIMYGMPCRKLKVIGVTGTDGKTTTSSMIFHVLKNSGKKVSVITSVGAYIGGRTYDTGFHVTTPDPQDIPKYMGESVRNGDEYFVLEVTSHALDQHRVGPIKFEVSGITNITHEHLGYHKTYEEYLHAKAKIICISKHTFVNADEQGLLENINKYALDGKISTYAISSDADFQVDINSRFGFEFESYNNYNALLAYVICKDLDISDEQFGNAMKSFVMPPGRMEVVYSGEFTVISDFAHTPNAISQALPAVLKKYRSLNRLIHVFGAAAYRDDSKRPEMGRASATYASVVILTEEDYRTEDPEKIFSMIAQGLESYGFSEIHKDSNPEEIQNKTYMKILKREQAIDKAIKIASKGDVVIITGKAQEKSLCRGKIEYPYDENKSITDSVASKLK